MAVDAVTASAELTPREKLRTGNTVPSEVAYMTHAHLMQHTEDVGALTADGQYAAHIWPEPDRHPDHDGASADLKRSQGVSQSELQPPAEAHVAAQAMPRKTDTCLCKGPQHRSGASEEPIGVAFAKAADTCDVPTWGTAPSQLRTPAVSTCSARHARLLARCEKTTHISRTGDACADTPIAMVTLYEPL